MPWRKKISSRCPWPKDPLGTKMKRSLLFPPNCIARNKQHDYIHRARLIGQHLQPTAWVIWERKKKTTQKEYFTPSHSDKLCFEFSPFNISMGIERKNKYCEDKIGLEFSFPWLFVNVPCGDFSWTALKGKLLKQMQQPRSKQGKQEVFKVYFRFTALH